MPLLAPVMLVAPDGSTLELRADELVRCGKPDACTVEKVDDVGISGPVWRVGQHVWTWTTSRTVEAAGTTWTVQQALPDGIPPVSEGSWRVQKGGASVWRDGQLIPGTWHVAWADCDAARPAARFVPFAGNDQLTPAVELGTQRHALLDVMPCHARDGKVPMLMFDYAKARENGQRAGSK